MHISTTETIRSVYRRKSSTTAIIFWRTGASINQVWGDLHEHDAGFVLRQVRLPRLLPAGASASPA
jgi:hypothetical protein